MEYNRAEDLAREFKLEAVRQAALSEKPGPEGARAGLLVGQLRAVGPQFIVLGWSAPHRPRSGHADRRLKKRAPP